MSEIIKALAATYEITGHSISPDALLIMDDDLSEYEERDVLTAISRCRKELSKRMVLQDIIDRIPGLHPGPEEAWNLLPKSEREGGYVTHQMMASAPFDLIDRGDLIAARKAFIETYSRADKSGKPEFFYSSPTVGSTEEKVDIKSKAIMLARDKKWISEDRAQGLLSQLSPSSKGNLTNLINQSNSKALKTSTNPKNSSK